MLSYCVPQKGTRSPAQKQLHKLVAGFFHAVRRLVSIFFEIVKNYCWKYTWKNLSNYEKQRIVERS
jgi:hypothetical protein